MTSLQREYRLGDLLLTDYPYSVRFGSDLGAPSLLDEPREMTLVVGIEGADLLELAENEAALRRECLKEFNELTEIPGDDFGPATVFDTTGIEARQVRYEDGGEQVGYREWELSITAAPHARSANLTAIVPLSVGGAPTTTVFDTCDSTTGWSATIDGVAEPATTFWEAGTVGVAIFDNPDGDADTLVLTRTGSVNFTTSPYLIVVAKVFSNRNRTVQVRADGVLLDVLSAVDLGDNHMKFTYSVPAITASVLTFTHVRPVREAWMGLLIHDLTKTNLPPGTTARQLSTIIDVGGTERTAASLTVSTAALADLGDTVVASWPEYLSGFSPSMRQRRTAGNTQNTDTTTMSGKREAIGPTAVEFGVPADSIPSGAYQIVARLRSVSGTGSRNIYWEAGTLVEGVLLDDTVSDSVDVAFATVGAWTIVPLGIVTLPVVAATAADLLIGINYATDTSVEYDEVWLFPVGDDCALTIAKVAAPYLWLDSPDLTEPVPRVRIGNTITRSNARSPGHNLTAMGSHVLVAGKMTVFTAALVDFPTVGGSYYARWHSNAGS